MRRLPVVFEFAIFFCVAAIVGCSAPGGMERLIRVNANDGSIFEHMRVADKHENHDKDDKSSCDEDDNDDDSDGMSACAKALGTDASRLVLAGDQDEVNVSVDSPVIVRLTGNQPTLHLRVVGSHDAPLKGLCVFLGGNKADLEMTIDSAVDTIHYVARGNQSQGHITVSDGATVSAIDADLSGNSPTLVIDGPGTYSCPSGSGVTCTATK